MSTELSGAQIVVKALLDQGVDTVFGYPGGAVLPIYDEIFQQKKNDTISSYINLVEARENQKTQKDTQKMRPKLCSIRTIRTSFADFHLFIL